VNLRPGSDGRTLAVAAIPVAELPNQVAL